MTIRSRTFRVATTLLAIACQAVYAEDFKPMFLREAKPASNTGGQVVVVFHTDAKLPTTIATISAAMKSRNPDGLIYKNWVTDIVFRGYDEKKNCGMIIGKWWSPKSGSMAEAWERMMMSKVGSSVNTITFQYARDGTLKVIDGTPGSNGDDVFELCLG